MERSRHLDCYSRIVYNVHLKSELDTLRVFKSGDSYDSRSPSILSATVHYISDHEIYLDNLKGELNVNVLRSIALKFHQQDCKVIRFERKGKMREILVSQHIKKKSFIEYLLSKLSNSTDEEKELV